MGIFQSDNYSIIGTETGDAVHFPAGVTPELDHESYYFEMEMWPSWYATIYPLAFANLMGVQNGHDQKFENAGQDPGGSIIIDDPGDQPSGIPGAFRIMNNFPNPFNMSTRFQYRIPKETDIHLDVIDTKGQKIRNLVDERKPAGCHEAVWNGKSDAGEIQESGMYLLLLTGEDGVHARKVILAK